MRTKGRSSEREADDVKKAWAQIRVDSGMLSWRSSGEPSYRCALTLALYRELVDEYSAR
jgi:hypothetical protein